MNKYVFWGIVTIELIVIIVIVIMGSVTKEETQDSIESAVYKEDETVASANGHADDTGADVQEDELTDGMESDVGESSEISEQEKKPVVKQDDEPVDVVDAREILKDHPECIEPYRKALIQTAYEYNFNWNMGYYLLEMNGDDIPELMVYEDNCHAGQVEIFTFCKDEAIHLGDYGENGKVYLDPKAHIVQDNYWMGGSGYYAYYDILSDKSVFRGCVGLIERHIEKLDPQDETDWLDSCIKYYNCEQPLDLDCNFDYEIDQKKYDELLSKYSDNGDYKCYDAEHYYAFGLEENLKEMLGRFIEKAKESPEKETIENAIASYDKFLNNDKLYEHFKKDPDAEYPVVFKAYLDFLNGDDIPELFVMGSSGYDKTGIGIFTYDSESECLKQVGEFFTSWGGLSYIPGKGVIAGSYELKDSSDLDVIIQIDKKGGSHVIKYYYRDMDDNCYEVYQVEGNNSGTIEDINRINTDIDKRFLVQADYYFKKRDNLLQGDNEKNLIFNGYDMSVIE